MGVLRQQNRYKTIHSIEANTELCISYGSRIWFDNKEEKDSDSDSGNENTFLSNFEEDADVQRKICKINRYFN